MVENINCKYLIFKADGVYIVNYFSFKLAVMNL